MRDALGFGEVEQNLAAADEQEPSYRISVPEARPETSQFHIIQPRG